MSDRTDVDLSEYNLDPPWITISVTTAGGIEQKVHVSGFLDRVYARRDRFPNIYELSSETTNKLANPWGCSTRARCARAPQ